MCISILLLTTIFSAPPLLPSDGWRTVFDGATLDGWTTTGGRYDGKAEWTVEEGVLTGREGPGHAGGLIYTERSYRNAEIELEAWISWPFDSGVFMRMRPEVRGAQLTLDYRPGGEVGGIYSEGFFFHNPDAAAKWRRDEWNRVRVRCVGDPMHLSMWLNGELVTDYRIPEGSGAFADSGKIGLQVHGGGVDGGLVRFRDVRVRELPDEAGDYWETDGEGFLKLTAVGEAAGWRSLFNGEDLTGWKAAGAGDGFSARGGVLALLTDGSSPYLATERDYRDFQLRLDFKISPMANSGLFLRAARDGSNPAFSGAEIQILDDFNWEEGTGSKLQPYQFTGGLYGAVAPARQALQPLGEWNTYQVTFRGSRILTVLNGQVLYDVDTHALELKQGAPFAERVPAGFIGLQRHAPGGGVEGEAYAWFRNLYLREL